MSNRNRTRSLTFPKLLRSLLDQVNLPEKKKKLVLASLAKAYSKKRWYFDCEMLLKELDCASASSSADTKRKGAGSSQSQLHLQGVVRQFLFCDANSADDHPFFSRAVEVVSILFNTGNLWH